MSRQLEGVVLSLPTPWQAGDAVTVRVDGQTLSLHVSPSAAVAVREAYQLQQVMGDRVDIEVDDACTTIISAQAVGK